MKLRVLGSSSKGNCYILETDTGKLILDCGIEYKEIQKACNFDFSDVRGCLITHEHKDHSKAAKKLRASGIDLYMSAGTLLGLDISCHHRCNTVHKQFTIHDFNILPFGTEHDALDPLGYLIEYIPTGERVLFATDTFYIRYKFTGLNYIIVECNYVKEILISNVELGIVNPLLADRLLKSHFGLNAVKDFLTANDLTQCNKIVLIHLSDANSSKFIMTKEIRELTGIETIVAGKGMEIELGCPF